MELNKDLRQRMIDRFRRLYRNFQGGIFTHKTKERMLTGKGISGRGRKKNQFWYRQRENVKTALIDLELFIEMAGKENVNKVLTHRALAPLVGSLLAPSKFDQDPDPERAEVARIFVQLGFDYLRSVPKEWITLSHERTITEAVDLSNYLSLCARRPRRS